MVWKWLAFLLTLNATSAFVMPRGAAAVRGSATKLNAGGTDVLVRNLAVAGRVPWKKLLISKEQGRKIMSIMRAETHALDMVILFVLAVFPDIVGRFLYEKIFYRLRHNVNYEASITYQVTHNLKQAARIGWLCYIVDTIEVALEVTGFKGHKVDVSTLFAKLIYATWALLRARVYKRSFFTQFVKRTAPRTMKKGQKGVVGFVDKVSDVFLFIVLALVWIDILQIKIGKGLSSVFALGGAGTFVLTLATQDLAKKAMVGLSLSASEAFQVGDTILLGDGTSGTVKSMGWLTTEIRGSDELVTSIPNTQLADLRISNRSRMKRSQVKQTLRFKHVDIDKIPDVVNEIKDEIAASCPKVITDGSRPFRVWWTDIDSDCVKVMVDCRLRNPPTGDKYYEARQMVMEAIAKALKRKKVDFNAGPTEVIHLNPMPKEEDLYTSPFGEDTRI